MKMVRSGWSDSIGMYWTNTLGKFLKAEVPHGENSLDTAKRELLEETGLVAGQYEKLLELHLSNSVSDEWGIVYLATDLRQEEAEPEETEELHIKKLTVEELYEGVEAGQITDSLTVAAAYKLMLLKTMGRLP